MEGLVGVTHQGGLYIWAHGWLSYHTLLLGPWTKASCNIMSPSIKSLVHQNSAHMHIMSLCTYYSVLALLRGRKDTAIHLIHGLLSVPAPRNHPSSNARQKP